MMPCRGNADIRRASLLCACGCGHLGSPSGQKRRGSRDTGEAYSCELKGVGSGGSCRTR